MRLLVLLSSNISCTVQFICCTTVWQTEEFRILKEYLLFERDFPNYRVVCCSGSTLNSKIYLKAMHRETNTICSLYLKNI